MTRGNDDSLPSPDEHDMLLAMFAEARKNHRMRSRAERRNGRWMIGTLATVALFVLAILAPSSMLNPTSNALTLALGTIAIFLFKSWRIQTDRLES